MTPTHVGDCPVMTFTQRPDGSKVVDRNWERFTIIDDDLFDRIPLRDMKRRQDGMAIEVTLRADNGWARYRRVGRDNAQRRSVWEVIESDWWMP